MVSPYRSFGLVAQRFVPGLDAIRVDERKLESEFARQVLQLGDRPAIQGPRGHDVVARLEHREQCRGLGGQAAGKGHPSGAAFQIADTFLKGGDGGVHDAGIRVAVFLKVEVGRGGLGIFEHEAGGLENGYRTGAGVRVGTLPGVHGARIEAKGARVKISHVFATFSRNVAMMGACWRSSSRNESCP